MTSPTEGTSATEGMVPTEGTTASPDATVHVDSPPPTTVLTVTADSALVALRAVVAEKGEDYIYQAPQGGPKGSCVYVWDVSGQLQPMCIVGYVLHRLGVPLELMYAEGRNGSNVLALAGYLSRSGYVIEEDAAFLLRAAQVVQDSVLIGSSGQCNCPSCMERRDATWGAALRRAEECAAQRTASASDAAAEATAADAPSAEPTPAVDAAPEAVDAAPEATQGADG